MNFKINLGLSFIILYNTTVSDSFPVGNTAVVQTHSALDKAKTGTIYFFIIQWGYEQKWKNQGTNRLAKSNFGILSAVLVSLTGWLAVNYNTSDAITVYIAIFLIVVSAILIIFVNKKAYSKIDELEEL